MSKENVIALAQKALAYSANDGEDPCSVVGYNDREGRSAIKMLTDNGLIIFRSDNIKVGAIADITPLGLQVNKTGLEKFIFQKENREFEIKELEFRKLKLDVTNAEWISKTYWWTFRIAIAAFIISLWNVVNSIFHFLN